MAREKFTNFTIKMGIFARSTQGNDFCENLLTGDL